ncbi:MAG: SMI1/KNR4 family protein [Chloroflexota bacterium]
MPTAEWQSLLKHWSQIVLSSGLANAFPQDAQASGWIGYAGATNAEIQAAEARLQTKLPLSYREFLQTSNGWRMTGPFTGRVWSVQEIEWLKVRRSNLVEDYLLGASLFGPPQPVPDQEYFIYGESQDSITARLEYLPACLEISDLDPGDGSLYLLNPRIITPDGEWEAWYLAPWLPGATRYPSFWELMQAELARVSESLARRQAFTPEYLDHVRKRLLPLEPVKETYRLPELLQQLEEEVTRLRSPVRPKPGEPKTLPLYQQRMADALQTAIDNIQAIGSRTQDPGERYQQLSALADELDSLGRQGTRAVMQNFDLGQVLKAGLASKLTGNVAPLDRQFQSSGLPAGYRTAAGIIRKFMET